MPNSTRFQYITLFFTLILLIGVLFFNVQGVLHVDQNMLPASLEVSASNAIAQVTEVSPPKSSVSLAIAIEPQVAEPPAPAPIPAPAPGVHARAALSIKIGENENQIAFAKNAQTRLPIASLTKLMTALVVLKHYDLEQKTVVGQGAMAQIGEQGALKEGETLSVKDLLYIMLMESSNRAAYALSQILGSEAFIARMNEEARNLGMDNTHFNDSTGLDAKSYSTVQDLAVLSQYLFERYPLFLEIIRLKEYSLYTDEEKLHHKLETTNKLLGQEGIIGGKTGWTNEARGCMMALVQNSDGSIAINIILGAEDRFLEMRKLIELSTL